MAYLFGLIVVALFFLVLHYFTELDKKQKLAATLIVLVIIGAAVGYNGYQDSARAKVTQIELEYNQGHTIRCGDVDVTKATFDYSVGTQTFIGREGTEHYSRMISAYECQ
jgi:hypothetical protein